MRRRCICGAFHGCTDESVQHRKFAAPSTMDRRECSTSIGRGSGRFETFTHVKSSQVKSRWNPSVISLRSLPQLLASGAHSIGFRMVVCCLCIDLTLMSSNEASQLKHGTVQYCASQVKMSSQDVKSSRFPVLFLIKSQSSQESSGSAQVEVLSPAWILWVV